MYIVVRWCTRGKITTVVNRTRGRKATTRGMDNEMKCSNCKSSLYTDIEIQLDICEDCAIDIYENQRTKKEQMYLEDDRNFTERIQ